MKKRILSVILALVIIAGMIPLGTMTALAGDSHTHDEIAFTKWESDNSLPTTEGNYYLDKDVTLSATWKPPVGTAGSPKVTNLCLNGHVIKANCTDESKFSVITVNRNAELNIYDCQTTEHAGYVDANGLWHLGEIPQGAENCTAKTVTGGIITGGNGGNGGGVCVYSGSFTMSGGSITGNTATSGGGVHVLVGGSFTMNGGSITGNTAMNGGGVFVTSSGFTMKGGSITGNTASGNGGGVCVNSGSFTMNGGSITGNTTSGSASGGGGGVSVFSDGNFTMNGGSITGNTASGGGSNGGGGVYVRGGTFTMKGGSITGNTTSDCGGGILNVNGELSLAAAKGKTITITGNTTTKAGGGVYNWNEMHLSGAVIIKGNTYTGNGDYPANLATVTKSGANKPIIIDDALNGSEIYVTHADFNFNTHDTGVLTFGYAANNPGAGLNDFFHYDGPSTFYMALESNELEVKAVPPDHYAVSISSTANGAVTADKQIASNDTVTLTVTPAEGYQLKTLTAKYNDGSQDQTITPVQDEQDETKYTFTMPAYAVTVSAEFELIPYNVTAQVQGSHGTAKVEVDSAEVTEAVKDTELTFTATPETGYAFDYWEVVSGGITLSDTDTDDLYKSNNPITVTMPDTALTLKAHFKALPPVGNTVTIQDNGHGTATAVNNEGTVSLTATPADGYALKEWQVISGSVTITDNAFTMPSGNVTIKAVFAPLYTVTAETDGHGASATASVPSALEGTTVTLTATAQEGYEFDSWQVISGNLEATDIVDNQFTMPASNVKVKAIFERVYNINMQDDGHGTASAKIDDDVVTTAASGKSITLVPQAAEGYMFDKWDIVSGDFTISDNGFQMPASNVTIKAIFKDECEYTKTVPLAEGTFGMKLGGKDAGEFTFEKNGSGWNIQNSESKYLAMQDGKLILSDTAFAWTYKNGAFSVSTSVKTTQKTSGHWIGLIYIPGSSKTVTVTTTYYLSTVTDGAKLSTNSVKAELYIEASGDHVWGAWTDCKDGENHKRVCKNCGEVEIEAHEFDPVSHKCVCGAYDPTLADVTISVSVKDKTEKQYVGFWPFGYYKNVKTYTATIKTEATGVKVTKVQYQLNGGRWTTGTSISSDKPISSLKVKVTDSNGKVYDYTYGR